MAATKAKKASRQAEVKKDRAERKNEIYVRWNRRVITRSFEREVARMDAEGATWEELTDLAMKYMAYCDWVSIEDLLAGTPFKNWLRFSCHLLRVIQLKEMPYDEYLQTPEWTERAAVAKSRLGGACALDLSHPAEHAHHRTYERRGRERTDDLIPLCAPCHRKFHGKS